MPAPDPSPGTVTMVQVVFPGQTNHHGTLFGGEALALMDTAGFVAATRWARRTLVTVASERVEFHAPARQGEIVEVSARVVATGRTSLTSEVTVVAENLLSGERRDVTTGRFVYVALDDVGRPVAVPSLSAASTPGHGGGEDGGPPSGG